jgi:hypothetical protein
MFIGLVSLLGLNKGEAFVPCFCVEEVIARVDVEDGIAIIRNEDLAIAALERGALVIAIRDVSPVGGDRGEAVQIKVWESCLDGHCFGLVWFVSMICFLMIRFE